MLDTGDDVSAVFLEIGRDVAGTNKSVEDMSRELMLDYMASEYSPANTVIVGDAAPADIAVPGLDIRVILDKANLLGLAAKGIIAPSQIPAVLAAFGPF